jgi:hypothetical protein
MSLKGYFDDNGDDLFLIWRKKEERRVFRDFSSKLKKIYNSSSREISSQEVKNICKEYKIKTKL